LEIHRVRAGQDIQRKRHRAEKILRGQFPLGDCLGPSPGFMLFSPGSRYGNGVSGGKNIGISGLKSRRNQKFSILEQAGIFKKIYIGG
jgi:hypothetical protein